MLAALCLPHIYRLTIYGGDRETLVVRGEAAVRDSLMHRGIAPPPGPSPHRGEPCHGPLHHARAQLVCPRCGEHLSRRALQLLPLPDAHWQELVDCWSCHRSEFAVVTTRLSWDGPTGQLLPQPASALLGGFWLTACADDVLLVGGCTCPGTRTRWQFLGETHVRMLISDLSYEREGVGATGRPMGVSLSGLVKDELGAAWDTLCTRHVAITVDGGDSTDEATHIECLAPRALVYRDGAWREGSLVKWYTRPGEPISVGVDGEAGALLRWPPAAYHQLRALLHAPCPIPLEVGRDGHQVAFLS